MKEATLKQVVEGYFKLKNKVVMSIKVMSWAWSLNVKSNLKLILLALADHADDMGRCWPGIEGIAEKCSMNRVTVCRNIKELLKLKLLFRHKRRQENGQQLTNVYVLNLNWGAPPEGNEQSCNLQPGRVVQSCNLQPETSINNINNIYNINNIDLLNKDIVQTEQTMSDLDTPKPSTKKRDQKMNSEELDELFESFWLAYPRKEQKKRSRQIFKKIPHLKDEFPKMIACIEAKQSEWKSDIKFCPMPSTWLNGERWNDEIYSTQRGSTHEARQANQRRLTRGERIQRYWNKAVQDYKDCYEESE